MSTWTFRIVKKKTVEPAQNYKGSITLKHFYTFALTKELCFFFLFKYYVYFQKYVLVDHLIRQYGNSFIKIG